MQVCHSKPDLGHLSVLLQVSRSCGWRDCWRIRQPMKKIVSSALSTRNLWTAVPEPFGSLHPLSAAGHEALFHGEEPPTLFPA